MFPELKQNKQTTEFAEATVSIMEEHKTKMQNLRRRWQRAEELKLCSVILG